MRIEELKAEVQRRIEKRVKDKGAKKPNPSPRYDEVFYLGVEWLNTL